MSTPDYSRVERIEQTDERLGRQLVHDERSRGFAHLPATSTSTLPRTFRLPVYNPVPNPRQTIGMCTGCDAITKANTKGNRIRGIRLGMDVATTIYSRATQLDPFPGSYPPMDTGSSGIAACKASREMGIIDRYEWVFNGARGIVTSLEAGRPVGIGAYWYNDMFDPDPETLLVKPTGGVAGGHQWTAIGWNAQLKAVEGLCLWGNWGRRGMFRITLSDLDALMADGGDAHVTYRRGANA